MTDRPWVPETLRPDPRKLPWVIAHEDTDNRMCYWTRGGFSAGGETTVTSLAPGDALVGWVQTFPSKAAAAAAYRERFGRLPRDHKAVQLTAEQAALLNGEAGAYDTSATATVGPEPTQPVAEVTSEPAVPVVTYEPTTALAEMLDGALRREARSIAHSMVRFKELIEQARTEQIHEALGFKSWTAYVVDVIGKEMKSLPVDDRRQIVGLLAGEGMSNRAVADAVGVSHPTVIRDKVAAEQVVHDVPPEPATSTTQAERNAIEFAQRRGGTVTGRDGKTYPARPKCPPEKKAHVLTPGERVVHDAQSIAADMRALAARLRKLWADDKALDPGYRQLETYEPGTPADRLEDAWMDLENVYREPARGASFEVVDYLDQRAPE